MCSATHSNRDRQTLKLRLIGSLAGTLGPAMLAYFTSREELPWWLQIEKSPVRSGLFLSFSTIFILEGILFLKGVFPLAMGNISKPKMKFFGFICICLGIALSFLWLNREFAMNWALRASFVMFVVSSVLSAIDGSRATVQLRARRWKASECPNSSS